MVKGRGRRGGGRIVSRSGHNPKTGIDIEDNLRAAGQLPSVAHLHITMHST